MNVKTFLNQTTFSKGILRAVVSVLLITWIGISSEAYAADARQSFKVSGLVTDKNGEPIIAANVFEPGTQNAATTDVDGKYAITVSGPQATISISYIGYSTQTVPVSGRGYIETVLLEDQQYLDELVVIGYGSQKKSDVTSSVASVKSESFNKGAILDAGQLVQGKVAGLQISLPNG
ncbi:MAG: carboxypeptidase-like regulatory domain-containing protein, partial [Bacteroidales bacterium]